MADSKNLLLLYSRPLEPSFIGKGPEQAAFNIPHSYLSDKYKPIGMQIVPVFADEAENIINVDRIRLPSLGEILDLKRDDNFSLFIPKHQHLAGLLIRLFMAMRNINELQSLVVYSRDRINPYLFNYGLSVALLHRSDTEHLNIPSLVFSFPEKFVESKAFVEVREEMTIVPGELRIPVVIDLEYTASNLESENRVSYFREDLGINLHHWHWHLIYPTNGPMNVVNKNRRGELFYYMHQQIIARYNVERLCNQLERVKRFIDWEEPIKEAYFPKLNRQVSNRVWPARVENQKLQNIARSEDELYFDIEELETWKHRIIEAIHTGFIKDENGEQIQLTEKDGIDVLGNLVEASLLSANRSYYGNLHIIGHILIAFISDPDNRHLESFGVMADTATAMRDPVFYRWHSYIDFIFQAHKSKLPPYPVNQLNFENVTITSVTINSNVKEKNELYTFWQQSDIDIAAGIDFQPQGSLLIRFTHLQHQQFTYTINVNNNGLPRKGTCRIFIAPVLDDKEKLFTFREQRQLFIALDRFTVDFQHGDNTITRSSLESTLTIPYEQTFRNLYSNRPTDGDNLEKFNFCGCGWPQHMLIPKGTPVGYSCHLFVMISNYEDDKVVQEVQEECKNADIYCGIKDKLYPDRRSMGYPFDRLPRRGANTLQQFLTSNMRVQEIKIFFEDIVKPSQDNQHSKSTTSSKIFIPTEIVESLEITDPSKSSTSTSV